VAAVGLAGQLAVEPDVSGIVTQVKPERDLAAVARLHVVEFDQARLVRGEGGVAERLDLVAGELEVRPRRRGLYGVVVLVEIDVLVDAVAAIERLESVPVAVGIRVHERSLRRSVLLRPRRLRAAVVELLPGDAQIEPAGGERIVRKRLGVAKIRGRAEARASARDPDRAETGEQLPPRQSDCVFICHESPRNGVLPIGGVEPPSRSAVGTDQRHTGMGKLVDTGLTARRAGRQSAVCSGPAPSLWRSCSV
jgi:hypothetical protein